MADYKNNCHLIDGQPRGFSFDTISGNSQVTHESKPAFPENGGDLQIFKLRLMQMLDQANDVCVSSDNSRDYIAIPESGGWAG